MFPYYVDLCTVSQTRRMDGFRGNPFGHAAMYIKGACKDETAPFPLLRRCRRVATDIDDPEHGAGVSVGRWYRNVNWVAVPGYELFYSGNLKPGERLTREYFDATVQAAIDKRVFDGVELHGDWTRNGDATLRDFVADRSITTDFALQFSRNVFCARVPVTEPVLDEVIAFLNDKNKEYATGKADYNWNLFADNCVHTVRNALAAANFWSPISVLQVWILHLFHLAVPAHEFVNLAVLGSEGPLDDYRDVYAEDVRPRTPRAMRCRISSGSRPGTARWSRRCRCTNPTTSTGPSSDCLPRNRQLEWARPGRPSLAFGKAKRRSGGQSALLPRSLQYSCKYTILADHKRQSRQPCHRSRRLLSDASVASTTTTFCSSATT